MRTDLPPPAAIQQLHHYAYKARDAEETRHFYEDILGLPLYHIIQSDYVPSTGSTAPTRTSSSACRMGRSSPSSTWATT
jgi:glyoxylase I family protein